MRRILRFARFGFLGLALIGAGLQHGTAFAAENENDMEKTEMNKKLAPTGVLRVAINLGNAILAKKDEKGELGGISVDLAKEFARQRGLPFALIPVSAAVKSVETVTKGDADLGFFAVDPSRQGAGVIFTDPYILIEGWFVVREQSSFTDNASVDKPGVRIAVGKGSAYDLFLTRHIKHATIDRGTTTPKAVDYFVEKGLEVAAGIRQQLEADMKRFPGLRFLPERFMVIPQAMGVPADRGEPVTKLLNAFLLDMRGNGFLADSVKKNGIVGAAIP
ncbi:MAG: transporter substrate-binding domain-containing protein [Desulfovibrio sp.]|jgi:polar amino acid transport system substrate-binding protein|nr:transporter substrate-binding domain-containing protein [Desulfovibrio sp.]